MANNLIEYKCPCCGGKIEFDSKLQKMKCPFCDTEFDVETLKNYDDILKSDKAAPNEMNWDEKPGCGWQDGETDNMSVYLCNSCGGEIVCDNTTSATHCPFCGNPVIITGKLTGSLRPDCVIPFKLDKEAAKAAFADHLKGKKLLPKAFRTDNHIDEIKGVYVPFWLFDTDSNARITYRATKVHTWSDDRYNYTDTRFYSVTRDGSVRFENIPVDGCSKIPNDLTESLEPFDFSQAEDFQTAYLSGYMADKYDVSSEECASIANERVRRSTESEFASTVLGYATVCPESVNIQLANGKKKYALLPVWLMTTTWNGKQYIFAMNGQTGKFVGDLPMDIGAYFKWLIGIAAIVCCAAFLLSFVVYLLEWGDLP